MIRNRAALLLCMIGAIAGPYTPPLGRRPEPEDPEEPEDDGLLIERPRTVRDSTRGDRPARRANRRRRRTRGYR